MSNASKVMLLTGCASGIGQHMANVLAAEGHRLIVTDLNLSALQNHADQMGWGRDQVIVRGLDVRDPETWEALIALAVEKWGRLDVLMNIAGYVQPAPVEAITLEQIDKHIDTNLKGVMYGTRAAVTQMLKQGGGQIITIASLAGISPVPGLALYSASKFGVRGFLFSTALELRRKGIKITYICPDAVQTPMLDDELDYDEAALVFSGFGVLTVQDIEAAIRHALKKAPTEITLPRYRGWTAKIAGSLPGLSFFLLPIFIRQGRRQQKKMRKHS